jgi:hypothetical protein
MIVAVGDEVMVPQPIHEPQQRHMDKQAKQEIEIGENGRAFLTVSESRESNTFTIPQLRG